MVPKYHQFRSQNPLEMLICHTPCSKTASYRTFCSKISSRAIEAMLIKLQDVLLHAPRWLTPCSKMSYSFAREAICSLIHP